MSIMAFDSHKSYTLARVENDNGEHPQDSGLNTGGVISPDFYPGNSQAAKLLSRRSGTGTGSSMRSSRQGWNRVWFMPERPR